MYLSHSGVTGCNGYGSLFSLKEIVPVTLQQYYVSLAKCNETMTSYTPEVYYLVTIQQYDIRPS